MDALASRSGSVGDPRSPTPNPLKRTFSQMNPLTHEALLSIPSEMEGFAIMGKDSWQLSKDDTEEFKRRVKKLKTLHVTFTPGLPDRDLETVVKVNEQLKHLKLQCRETTDSFFTFLTTNRLTFLSLINCNKLSPAPLIKLLQKNPQLVELRLSDQLVTRETAQAIVKYCHHLQILELTWFRDLPEECLMEIAINCPQLEELVLKYGTTCTDDVLCRFLQNGRLRRIATLGCNVGDRSLLQIAALGLPLTALDVSGCSGITSRGLDEFLKATKHSLKSLSLGGCQSINGDIVRLLCMYRPKLEHLNLSIFRNSNPIDGSDILEIVQVLSQPVPYLRSLEIKRISDVDEPLLKQLKENCNTLETIRIYINRDGDWELPARFAKAFNGTVRLVVT